MGILLLGIAVGMVILVNKSQGSKLSENSVSSDWTKYDELFKRHGRNNGVNWEWLKAIALNESNLGRDSLVKAGKVSSDGLSWGLMQLKQSTANDFKKGVTIADLNNPEISVEIAAKYVSMLQKLFSGDQKKIIMSYNQGQGNTLKGKTYALGYYEKWLKNLSLVRGMQ